MKKVIIALAFLGLAVSASAQKSVRAPIRHPRPPQKVVVVRSYPPFSPYFGYGRSYYGYSPFGFGYGFDYGYRHQNRPSKLDLQVEDVKNDYQDRVWSVRHDDGLSRKEKRKKIQELKYNRDNEIIDLRKSYYKTDARA
jgi:hypothetical protein